MHEAGRWMFFSGLVMAALGLLVWKAGLGTLPGDFTFRRGSFTFFLPLATSILLSLGLTLVFWLLRR